MGTSLLRGVNVLCKDFAKLVTSAICEISALDSVVGAGYPLCSLTVRLAEWCLPHVAPYSD